MTRERWRALPWACAAAIAASVQPYAQDSGDDILRALIADVPCGAQAGQAIDRWRGLTHAALRDPDAGSMRAFRVPTRELGVWIRVELPAGAPPAVTRVSSQIIDERRWMTDCSETSSTRARPEPHGAGEARFTDDDLRAALARGAAVIYVWSPHMPLSVDGYHQARAAAERQGLAFIPLLDPLAGRAYARAAAERAALPDSALRRLDSIELAFRGMTLHAPSLLVFRAGAIAGSVLYGYRDAAAYAGFIAEATTSSPR